MLIFCFIKIVMVYNAHTIGYGYRPVSYTHLIISFDPRDGTDNGLTVDRAQELGEKFCKEHFPGHQAIVCTHPDGHNHSGNIRCV